MLVWYPRLYRVGAKHGLWTLDWTHGLDRGLRFGLDFGLIRSSMTTISNIEWPRKLCTSNCLPSMLKDKATVYAVYATLNKQSVPRHCLFLHLGSLRSDINTSFVLSVRVSMSMSMKVTLVCTHFIYLI